MTAVFTDDPILDVRDDLPPLLDRVRHVRLDTGPILGHRELDDALERDRGIGSQTVDPVHLAGPVHVTRRHVPIPRTEMRQLLRLRQTLVRDREFCRANLDSLLEVCRRFLERPPGSEAFAHDRREEEGHERDRGVERLEREHLLPERLAGEEPPFLHGRPGREERDDEGGGGRAGLLEAPRCPPQHREEQERGSGAP